MKAAAAILLFCSLSWAGDFTAHVSGIEDRLETTGSYQLTPTVNAPVRHHYYYLTVQMEGHQYLLKAKNPIALGDYEARYITKGKQTLVEFQLPNRKPEKLRIVGESEIN